MCGDDAGEVAGGRRHRAHLVEPEDERNLHGEPGEQADHHGEVAAGAQGHHAQQRERQQQRDERVAGGGDETQRRAGKALSPPGRPRQQDPHGREVEVPVQVGRVVLDLRANRRDEHDDDHEGEAQRARRNVSAHR